MYPLYNLLFNLWLRLYGPTLLKKQQKRGRPLSDINQRLGDVSSLPEAIDNPTVWFHSCSVGETLSIQNLVAEFHAAAPDVRFLFTTVTSTGQAIARERFGKYGDNCVFYLPLDTISAVSKTLDRIKPDMLVIVDTEIWPNLLREAKRRNVSVVMVNGRISPKSFATYRWVTPMLTQVFANYRALLAGSQVDADRLQQLGARRANIETPGNLKYDLASSAIDRSKIDKLAAALHIETISGPIIVAGSTHPGEESVVLVAFKRVKLTPQGAKSALILAPRHPERAGEVEALAMAEGLSIKRRSLEGSNDTDVILLDTVGELAAAYSFAAVAFVGGTLTPVGGHSILEPAAFSKPIIVGPHMENSPGVIDAFVEKDAIIQIEELEGNPSGQTDKLFEAVSSLIGAPKRALDMGQRARNIVDENSGATGRILALLQSYLQEARVGK
jgi:3-deoxy-D-manno-octulosonic-acid transferase